MQAPSATPTTPKSGNTKRDSQPNPYGFAMLLLVLSCVNPELRPSAPKTNALGTDAGANGRGGFFHTHKCNVTPSLGYAYAVGMGEDISFSDIMNVDVEDDGVENRRRRSKRSAGSTTPTQPNSENLSFSSTSVKSEQEDSTCGFSSESDSTSESNFPSLISHRDLLFVESGKTFVSWNPEAHEVITGNEWVCSSSSCGFVNATTSEFCRRCKAHNGLFRVFIGQVHKDETARFVHFMIQSFAPEVMPAVYHIESHTNSKTGQGKGCAWVYLNSEEAMHTLIQLNRRLFVDVDDTNKEQGVWVAGQRSLEDLAGYAARRAYLNNRPKSLPRQPVVIEKPQRDALEKQAEYKQKKSGSRGGPRSPREGPRSPPGAATPTPAGATYDYYSQQYNSNQDAPSEVYYTGGSYYGSEYQDGYNYSSGYDFKTPTMYVNNPYATTTYQVRSHEAMPTHTPWKACACEVCMSQVW